MLIVSTLLAAPAGTAAQGTAEPGLYRVDAGRHVIVRGTPPDGLSVLDTRTGQVRNLTSAGAGAFTHGPTRSRSAPISGRVTFDGRGGLSWNSEELGALRGTRVESTRREVVIETRDEGRLSGELFLPPSPGRHPVTVVVPLGDRQSLWEPAMWLLAAGQGIFVYDQRGSGASTGRLHGPAVSHTIETLQFADDAVAVLGHVRGLPGVDPKRVGILGWSQGGWVGAMAASRDSAVAWYVNIAANANPWPEQAERRFLARLQREGFKGPDLAEARRYFDALRAVTDFRIGWDEYVRRRDRVANEQWYRTITEIFPFFTYADYGEALGSWAIERDPADFFRRLSVTPTLGVYFEHDQSNPPDSPSRFRRAVELAGNDRVEVRIFPGVNHGAWVVDGLAYDAEVITQREPAVFDTIAAWVARRAAPETRATPEGPVTPACAGELYRQFDALLGEWDNTESAPDASGALRVVATGRSAIRAAAAGCAWLEERTVRHADGEEYALLFVRGFDPDERRWHQILITSFPAWIPWRVERLDDNRMRFHTRRVLDGRTVLFRMTEERTGPGAFLRRFERSRDSGGSWSLDAVIEYTRR